MSDSIRVESSMSTREWIIANIERFNGRREDFMDSCIEECNVARRTVNDTLSRLRNDGSIPKDAMVANLDDIRKARKKIANSKCGDFSSSISIDDIKSEFDHETKIELALEKLNGRIIKDNDFRAELGVSHDRWKEVIGLSKFADNKIELRGKRFKGVYWGSKEAIDEVRKSIELTR